jgi:hypothetical protein
MVACDNDECPYEWFHWESSSSSPSPLGDFFEILMRPLALEERLIGFPLADDEDEDEGNEDSKVYCTCRTVSHGDMVACDNDECPMYQHY